MEARWKNTIFANGSNYRILFCEARDFHTHLAQLNKAPVKSSEVKHFSYVYSLFHMKIHLASKCFTTFVRFLSSIQFLQPEARLRCCWNLNAINFLLNHSKYVNAISKNSLSFCISFMRLFMCLTNFSVFLSL